MAIQEVKGDLEKGSVDPKALPLKVIGALLVCKRGGQGGRGSCLKEVALQKTYSNPTALPLKPGCVKQVYIYKLAVHP